MDSVTDSEEIVLKKFLSPFAAFGVILIFAIAASAIAASAIAATAVAAFAAAAPASSLSIQKLEFVDEIMGLSQYELHPGGMNYTQDEECTVYVEAAGFSTPPVEGAQGGREEYRFGLTLDVAIKDSTGRTLASQSGVDQQEGTVSLRLPLHYLGLTFPLAGWPEGNYVMEVGVRDILSGQTVTGELHFNVIPGEAK